MADIVAVLPQQLTQGDTRPLKVLFKDNGDGSFSIAATIMNTGLATESKQDTTNIKLDQIIEEGLIKKALTELIDVASGTVTYIGQAEPGTLPGAATWRIKRITVAGSLTSIEWAEGVGDFDKEWDERATYNYS